ncbi:hypothetical protein QQ045_016150 [Rhodiola kirilowii]
MKIEKSAVVSRSNRFLCFKPVGIDIEPVTVTDKVLFYPLPHRRRNQIDTFMSDKERKIDSREDKVSIGRRFSRALKAIMSKRKSRNRNHESGVVGNNSMRSDSSCSFRFMKRDREFESKIGLTKSSSMRSTSSSSSSSCLSSQPSELQSTSVISSSNSNPNSKPPKQSSLKKQSSGKEHKQISSLEQSSSPSYSSIIIGLLLLLLILTLTIFCGKVCAIVLNAMCLYWIPQKERLTSSRRPRAETEDVERLESSREQRRRVIMEGLLDRSHHHHHHHN